MKQRVEFDVPDEALLVHMQDAAQEQGFDTFEQALLDWTLVGMRESTGDVVELNQALDNLTRTFHEKSLEVQDLKSQLDEARSELARTLPLYVRLLEGMAFKKVDGPKDSEFMLP